MNVQNSQTEMEEHQEVFRKLAHFTAPLALGRENLPQSIIDNLVEHALYLQTKAVPFSGMLELLKSQFKLNFDIDEIKTSLRRLVESNFVVNNHGDYSLEIRRRASFQKSVNEKKEYERQILQKLKDHIKDRYKELTNEVIEIISIDFNLFLINFFMLSGAEAVQLIYGNPKEIADLISKAQKKNIFDLLPNRDNEIRVIEQKEFCEFVNLLSDQEKLYLQDLLDRSLQYFTITVDKKCEALLTADFADWSLYIDTNFIYNLLGLNNSYAGARKKNAERILEIGKKVNIKFFVSPVTIEEFTTSVSKAKEFLLNEQIARKLYKIAGEASENNILIAYYDAYIKGNIAPRDFLAKIDNIKDVLMLYGIEEKADYSKSIKGTKEFSDAVKLLEKLSGKDQNVAEHDAFHYLLILKLRSREGADNTFKTNKSWFLTNDSSLAPFDREVRKSEIPFCIRPYQLRQILRPLFSRTDDFEGVFADFISEPTSRAFTSMPTEIAMEVLSRVTYFEKEFNVKNSPELATKILTNEHFINQLRQFNNDEAGRNKFIDQEIKSVAQIVDGDKEAGTQQVIVRTVKNYWNFINPFWLIWKILILIKEYILGHIKISIISIMIVILGLVATDYSLAWKNLKSIWDFLTSLHGN